MNIWKLTVMNHEWLCRFTRARLDYDVWPYIYIHTHIYIYREREIYIHTYIYTYTYTCTYTYTYTFVCCLIPASLMSAARIPSMRVSYYDPPVVVRACGDLHVIVTVHPVLTLRCFLFELAPQISYFRRGQTEIGRRVIVIIAVTVIVVIIMYQC